MVERQNPYFVVGQRLRSARKAAQKTLDEVARHLGVSPTLIGGYYEAGKVNIPMDRLSRLAGLYGVSVDWLLGRRGQPDDPTPQDQSDLLAEADLAFRSAGAELPPEDLEEIRNFIEWVKHRRGQEKPE